MNLHPMDTLAWATLLGAPICFAVGAYLLHVLQRLRRGAAQLALVAPVLLTLFVAPALGMVRTLNRFEDYDLCVASRAAIMGETEICPEWTVKAFEAAGGHADI